MINIAINILLIILGVIIGHYIGWTMSKIEIEIYKEEIKQLKEEKAI